MKKGDLFLTYVLALYATVNFCIFVWDALNHLDIFTYLWLGKSLVFYFASIITYINYKTQK